jgi:putative nucleotidyltransferase with HDIG domain
MDFIHNDQMINIMQSTLNHVDPRLMNHGKRVSYMMFRVLKPQNRYSDRELRDIGLLAILHDIGAYKTEEIDRIVLFETTDVWEHSVYGFLFLQYFSPLRRLAPVVLYHHANCEQARGIDPALRELAQLLSLCDRADMFLQGGRTREDFYRHLEARRGVLFDADAIERFQAADIAFATFGADLEADGAFAALLESPPFTEAEIAAYIDMVIYSIEFRSNQTVIHTISVASITDTLAEFLGADAETRKRIHAAAMLHDIGKITTPTRILESNARLNDAEMALMRAHVTATESILHGHIDEDIVNMAARHHEKLNGAGYPKALRAEDLSVYDRLVAVADIFGALCYARSYKDAFPKEKVVSLMRGMSAQGLLDPELVALALERYEEIIERANAAARPIEEAYHALQKEYEELRAGL